MRFRVPESLVNIAQSPKFHKTGRQLGSRSTLNSLPASCASRVVADLVAILGKDRFAVGPVEAVVTASGVALSAEQTPSGRFVVGAATAARVKTDGSAQR
jgi:hypothetical protein